MTDLSSVYIRLPNWIGDVCMALPSLELVLATGRPVVVCARPWARDLLAAYPLAGFIPMTGHWRADRAAVARFRKAATTTYADNEVGLLLPDSLSSALVFRLAGLPCAGYRDDGRRLLLRWPIRKPAPRPHAVESWYGLTRTALTHWGAEGLPEHPGKTLDLKITPQAHVRAHDCLTQAGLNEQAFVLIAPTATGQHKGRIKVWPHFDALTRRLQSEGLTVVMCPPPAEREAALANAPTAICLPALPLDAFVALTRAASLVVCNDSGVSHLAAAAHAQQTTLFGVTDRTRTGPWSDRAHCMGALNQWPELDKVVEKTILLCRS